MTARDQSGGGLLRRLPFVFHPSVEDFIAHPHNRREVLKDHDFSLMFDKNIIGSVARLLSRSSPSAIARFVVAVHIYSIQREPFRTLAHICEKGLKTLRPFAAHRNPARAIVGVLGIVWIQAALLCMAIRAKCAGGNSPDAVAVRNRARTRNVFAEAATARRYPATDPLHHHFNGRTAIAVKQPRGSPAIRGDSMKGSKATISLASDVQCCDHTIPLIVAPQKVYNLFGKGWTRRVTEVRALALGAVT